MTRHSASGGASTARSRRSVYAVPPDQRGSDGSGSAGASGPLAFDQRVSTCASRTLDSASATAWSKPVSPSGGSGTYSAMSCSCATASCTRLSTSGRAIAFGTGVIRPTQCEDSDGVSGRTGRMTRGRSPATRA